jgi:NADH-quinone oxidoreductase subunit N
MSSQYIKQERLNLFEYVILIGLVCLGLMLLIASHDLISLYLALELQSLSLYVLATLKRNSEFSTEAGLKYFILGAVASGFYLFGASLIYGFTGLYKFEDLSHLFVYIPTAFENGDFHVQSIAVLIGLAFIAMTLLFKMTAAPFHMWAPDVYEGAPTCVTAFFAMTPKIALIGLLLRLMYEPFYEFIDAWQNILILSAALSVVIGSLAALAQTKLKRLFAYSSVAHCGYMLIGITTGTLEGLEGTMLYIFIYILMVMNVFSFILAFRSQSYKTTHMFQQNKTTNTKTILSTQPRLRMRYITDLAGLGKANPLAGISLTLVLFSMAGIPPLAGFFGKFQVFFAAMDASLYGLAILGVLASGVGCFYYIRLIKIMYFDPLKEYNWFQQIDKENAFIISFTTLFALGFVFYPAPFYLLAHKAVFTLYL